MEDITEIMVEEYLKDKLPQVDNFNSNAILNEMGITKDKGEYVLDHNKFSKYMRKYINVVYQNNRSELAIYNYSQKKYEINYVNVLLEKIVKFFLSYVKELWTPKWEEVIIKTLKRDISTVVTNFDNGDYINLIDGILDLKDFELKPHSPDYYTTTQLPIAADLKYSQSTIRRGIHDLKKAGLLETEQRYRKKGGKSSLLFRLKAE